MKKDEFINNESKSTSNLQLNVIIAGGPLTNSRHVQFLKNLTTAIIKELPFSIVATGGIKKDLRVSSLYADFIAADSISILPESNDRLITFIPEKKGDNFEYFSLGKKMFISGDRKARRNEMIKWAGFLFTIGGRKTAVPYLIDSAYVSNTPFLPIAFAGGTSFDKWKQHKKLLINKFSLTEADVNLLESLNFDNDIEKTVQLLIRILKKYSSASEKIQIKELKTLSSFRVIKKISIFIFPIIIGLFIARHYFTRSQKDSEQITQKIISQTDKSEQKVVSAINKAKNEIIDTLQVGEVRKKSHATKEFIIQSIKLAKISESEYSHSFRGAVPLPFNKKIAFELPQEWKSGSLLVKFNPKRSVLKANLYETKYCNDKYKNILICTMSFETNECSLQLTDVDNSKFVLELMTLEGFGGDCAFELNVKYSPIEKKGI